MLIQFREDKHSVFQNVLSLIRFPFIAKVDHNWNNEMAGASSQPSYQRGTNGHRELSHHSPNNVSDINRYEVNVNS